MLERCRWLWSSLWTVGLVFAFVPIAVEATSCPQGITTLRVQLPRPSQPEYAGFVVPSLDRVQGAPKYSDECLQVMVAGGGFGFDTMTELKNGNVDLAIAEGSYVAKTIADGTALKVIAGYYQKNGLVWVGLRDKLAQSSTLQSLQDFRFKFGYWEGGYRWPIETLMSQQTPQVPDVTYAEQVPAAMSQLEGGTIDLAAAMVYGEYARLLQVKNTSTNYLRQSSDVYVLDPSTFSSTLTQVHNVLAVTSSTLSAKRASIVKFLKVVTKTWYFCRVNEAACAAAFSEYNEIMPHLLWQMREVNRFIFPSPSGHGLGVLSTQRWNAMNAWMVQSSAVDLVSFQTAVGDGVIDNSLVLEAGALDNISAWTSISSGTMEFCAISGSSDYRICKGGENTYCSAGWEPLAHGTCQACVPGRYSSSAGRMNTCKVCAAGTFATAPGMSACGSCAPGRFWDTALTNEISCKSCPAGRFTNTAGASTCRSCAIGFFVSTGGAVVCDRCPTGRFGQQQGASECQRCQEGMATLQLASTSSSDCVCPKDTYLKLNTQVCLPCPEGMLCGTNSKESNLLAVTSGSVANGSYPLLMAGYWSSNTDPLSIYLCRKKGVCPGGVFGLCGTNMVGRACGQCQTGYYRDGTDCLECAGIDETAFNYPLLPCIGGPIVIFFLYVLMRDTREDWGNWCNELSHLTFILLVHYQYIGHLGFTFIQFPDVLASVLTPFLYLVDVASVLRLECFAFEKFHAALIVKETVPGLVLALFFVTYCFFYVVGKIFGLCRYLEKQEKKIVIEDGAILPKLVALCPLKADGMINLYLTVFHTFYLSVCFVSLQLFMCYQNPNSKYTILLAPEVTCYDTDEWKAILTEAIFALFFYIAAPISGFTYLVILAPMRFHKVDFHTRWKCLFIKFKADAFWWTVFQQLRILALCLMLVLTQQGSRQAYVVFCLTLFYVAVLVVRFPWRHRSTNLFDLLANLALLYFCAISASFTRRYDWLDDQIAESAVVSTFTVIPVTLGLLCAVFWVRVAGGSSGTLKKKKMELAASSKQAFAKFVGLENAEAQAFCLRLSEQDRDILRNAVAMILAELLGTQPAKALLPPRLVDKERKAGARMWTPASNNQETGDPAKV